MSALPPSGSGNAVPSAEANAVDRSDDGIDFQGIWALFVRGLPMTIGLGLLGFGLSGGYYLAPHPNAIETTSVQVSFAFPGFERGKYPNGSNFQATDLCSPTVVAEALQHERLDTSAQFSDAVSDALSIEMLVPSDVARNQEHLRDEGQTPPTYTSNQYLVTLTVPRNFPLTRGQRELLLNEIVAVYRENFDEAYSPARASFSDVFATLRNANFPDYRSVLDAEMSTISDYLSVLQKAAPTFRSSATHLSFGDLSARLDIFEHVYLDETLGLIELKGVSLDHQRAMMKLNYDLQTVEDGLGQAADQNQLISRLLAGAGEHAQGYTLAVKSTAAEHGDTPVVLDQGMINSLLANDEYNFLIRKALDAGTLAAKLQAERDQLLELRQRMESFDKLPLGSQSSLTESVLKSIATLQGKYTELISEISQTGTDFDHQWFADAVRITSGTSTSGETSSSGFLKLALAGLVVGMAFGAGLSLLGVAPGRRHRPRLG